MQGRWNNLKRIDFFLPENQLEEQKEEKIFTATIDKSVFVYIFASLNHSGGLGKIKKRE